MDNNNRKRIIGADTNMAKKQSKGHIELVETCLAGQAGVCEGLY